MGWLNSVGSFFKKIGKGTVDAINWVGGKAGDINKYVNKGISIAEDWNKTLNKNGLGSSMIDEVLDTARNISNGIGKGTDMINAVADVANQISDGNIRRDMNGNNPNSYTSRPIVRPLPVKHIGGM